MSAAGPKRTPTRILDLALDRPADPLEQIEAPEALAPGEGDAEAAELEAIAHPKPKRKLPKHRSGSMRHPYETLDGREIAKMNVNVSLEFARQYRVFCVEHLAPGQKGAWTEAVLRKAMAKVTRKAGRT